MRSAWPMVTFWSAIVLAIGLSGISFVTSIDRDTKRIECSVDRECREYVGRVVARHVARIEARVTRLARERRIDAREARRAVVRLRERARVVPSLPPPPPLRAASFAPTPVRVPVPVAISPPPPPPVVLSAPEPPPPAPPLPTPSPDPDLALPCLDLRTLLPDTRLPGITCL